MKILIISDSHGNVANLTHVMEFAKKYGVSAIIHAGDWNTSESIDAVLSFGIPLYTVLGNADIRKDVISKLKLKTKGFNEHYLIATFGEKRIGITHKPSDNNKYFKDKKVDLIINGHRHFKDDSIKNGIRTVRPGGIIRGINFAVYDTGNNKIEFVSDVEI